jgi:outer membrane protein
MRIKRWIATTLLFLFFSLGIAHASDEIDPDLETETSFWDDFLWDASVGAGFDFNQNVLDTYDHNQLGIFVDINFSLEYKRFYLEVQRSTLPGGSIIGFHLWQGELWTIDVIGSNYAIGFDENGSYSDSFEGDDYHLQDESNNVLTGITPRVGDFNVGLKFYREFSDYNFSSELVHDIRSTHNSWMSRNIVSKALLAGNWDLIGGVGFDIYSAKMANYYYGISEDEVNDLRSFYKPGLSGSVFTQLSAEYPISEHWIYHSAVSIGAVSNSIKKSSIVSSDPRVVIDMGVRYVF